MYYYPQQQQQQSQYAAGINYMQPQIQTVGLKGRPVSSIEEVRAAQIDFDGSLFVFPDIANKCIYTKQISATGSAVLNKYTLQEETPQAFPSYVTKEELDNIIAALKAEFQSNATPVEAKEPKPILPQF